MGQFTFVTSSNKRGIAKKLFLRTIDLLSENLFRLLPFLEAYFKRKFPHFEINVKLRIFDTNIHQLEDKKC
jgi:hypothetical protein